MEFPVQPTSTPAYSSALSSKAALIDETLTILREIDHGHSPDEVRAWVMERDLLGKETMRTRESAWEHVHARYLADERRRHLVARMVVRAPDRATQKLVLFYELCRSSLLLRDTMLGCVYPRYAAGFSSISKADIQQYFDSITEQHPELKEWSPQTRAKVVSNILTILRDFGLLQGTQRRHFVHLHVPLAAFVYVLYRLAEDGLTTPQALLGAKDWRIFFLDRSDVLHLLDEATVTGHCTFKHQGDVYTLNLHYPSLEACVEALTGKV